MKSGMTVTTKRFKATKPARPRRQAAKANAAAVRRLTAGKFVPPELVITPAAMDYMAKNPRLYHGVKLVIDIHTPDAVRADLDMHGGKNRRSVKSNTNRLTADMKGGRYVQDLRTKLVRDRDSNIIDGGNTCESIVRSGVSLLLLSLENVPTDVQDVIDQGAKRTATHINELRDAKEGKQRKSWTEVTRVVKALWWVEGKCPGATETQIADFARLHEKLIRQVIALSGTPENDPSSYPRLRLAPIRAAFFSYALSHRGGITLVRHVMSKIREMRFAQSGDPSKAFMDAFSSLNFKTTNMSGAKSRRDLFPLAAAVLLAEKRGLKLGVDKLRELASDPGTLAEFVAQPAAPRKGDKTPRA